MEPFEHKGYWWLPENPDRRVAGILRFDGIELPKLELFDTLENHFSGASRQAKILGVIAGKYATLLDCILIRENPTYATGVEPVTFADYLAHHVFIADSHIEIETDLFKSMRTSYFNLPGWVEAWGWRATIDGVALKIEHRPPDATARIAGANISVRHQFSGNNSLTQQTVTQSTFIDIEPDKPQSFAELSKIQHNVSIFMSLAMSQATYPITEVMSSDRSLVPVSVHYSPNVDTAVYKAKAMPAYQMLFKFEDIFADFENVLQNWFSKAEKLDAVYKLYSSTLLRPAAFLEQKFLNLVQALETYHRNTYSLNRKLELRLKDLLVKHVDVVKFITAVSQNPDDFAHRVTGARDWYTHYDDKNRQFEPDTKDLWDMVQYLRFIVEACLLTELGIPEYKIQELMRRAAENRF